MLLCKRARLHLCSLVQLLLPLLLMQESLEEARGLLCCHATGTGMRWLLQLRLTDARITNEGRVSRASIRCTMLAAAAAADISGSISSREEEHSFLCPVFSCNNDKTNVSRLLSPSLQLTRRCASSSRQVHVPRVCASASLSFPLKRRRRR